MFKNYKVSNKVSKIQLLILVINKILAFKIKFYVYVENKYLLNLL